MHDQAAIDRIYKWADKNRKKYETVYQIDGSPSALKTFEKYDDICDICDAASRGNSEENLVRKGLRKNQTCILEQFKDMQKVSPNKTFTYEEVEKWMRKMMIW